MMPSILFDYNHPVYREARDRAFLRSEGWCQFCGLRKAEEAHHWRGYVGGDYKREAETTANDLIALCSSCHKIATTIRDGYKLARDEAQERIEVLEEELEEMERVMADREEEMEKAMADREEEESHEALMDKMRRPYL